MVVESDARARRDTKRTTELIAAAETQLLALEHRVRSGRLKDPAKIGRAAQRILGTGRVGRLFDLEIETGRFLYHYNEDTQAYEKLLAGRYVLTTSLTSAQADTAEVVAAYRQLQTVENKFRVLKDFLRLRPVRHWTEKRVRGHVAVCVYAALMETLITQALTTADVRDPDRTPTPHRQPGPPTTQPRPPRGTDHQQPPDHAHHPTNPPTNPGTRRYRSRHPHLGQSHHHLTPPPAPNTEM